MVVHPGAGNFTGTLINAIAWYLKDLEGFDANDPEVGLVHRIDKDTSGLIVVAKTSNAKTELGKQFFNKTTHRSYNALVWGNVVENEGSIEGNIARDPKNRLRMKVFPTDSGIGKPAITHYRVLERFGYTTLVECVLETGRTHQIRVHMSSIGHPLLGDDVYVIEVNPRSSRTVPYISKVTGIPIVPLATKVILGYKLKDMGYEPGLQPEAKHYAIKMPVFSFEKIRGADISLGPEMKSTGECLGIAETFNEALYKAFIGAGIRLPKHKNMIITVKDEDKQDIIPIARRFEALGYRIYATLGTAKVLKENGIKVIRTNKLEQPAPNLMDLILGHKIDVVIDTPPQGVEHQKDGFVIRRNAIETGVNVLTSLDTAEALATSLENTDLNNLSLIDIATIARR